MRFKDSVSIFNRLKVGNTIQYNKTLIKNALWFDSVSSTLIKQGLVDLNAKTIYIPHKQIFTSEYILPESYERLTEGIGYFTINNGDYIGLGDIELNQGESVQAYKNRTGLLFEIKTVSDYKVGINQHWEIIAD